MRFSSSLLLILLVTVSLEAQTPEAEEGARPYLSPGLVELNLNAALNIVDNEDGSGVNADSELTSVGAEGFLGVFVGGIPVDLWFVDSILFQVGPVFNVDWVDQEIESVDFETVSYTLGPQITVNLVTLSPVIPFVAVAGGPAFVDVDSDLGEFDQWGGFFKVGGGLRVFLAEGASLNLGVAYEQIFFDEDEDEPLDDVDDFSVTLGISLYFGGE